MMRDFFIHNLQFLDDLIYFHQQYPYSIQYQTQSINSSNLKEIFEQAVYCFLTPATKSDSADQTHKILFKDQFFYKASQEELASCLRGPPYIRFHNQKAERLYLWQQQGMDHITKMLCYSSALEQRKYLIEYVKGMNYKEATHFLRNIGRSEDLVILDRHIINFMKDICVLTEKDDMKILAKNYLKWEQLFIDFIKSDTWVSFVGASSIPRADFAIWAARVKQADSTITYERILTLR